MPYKANEPRRHKIPRVRYKVTLLHGPDDWRPVSAGRRRFLPDLTSDAYLAFQAEPGPPPPYSKAEAPGHELARV